MESYDYLLEIESITYNENCDPIFAEKVYHSIRAKNDKDACRIARNNFCIEVVNPYGQKTTCALRAIYRKGMLY